MYTVMGWLCVVAGVGVVLRLVTHKQLYRDTLCGKCGYAREGFKRCPECGTAEQDQRRVWRRKYRRVYVGIAVLCSLGFYVVTHVPGVQRAGWFGLAPDMWLLQKEYATCVAWLEQVTLDRDLRYAHNQKWHRELEYRLYYNKISDWELRWTCKRLIALLDRDDVTFQHWCNACKTMLLKIKLAGAMDETVFFDIARERMILCREWWVQGEPARWKLGSEWLLRGRRERTLTVEINDNPFATRKIRVVQANVHGDTFSNWLNMLPNQEDGGYLFRYSLTESRGGEDVELMSGSVEVPFHEEIVWDEEAMPAECQYLQTEHDWADNVPFFFTGTEIRDGVWQVESIVTMAISNPELQHLGVGAQISIQLNGEVLCGHQELFRTNPRGDIGWSAMHQRGFRYWDRPPSEPIIFDPAAGDTLELVVKSDCEKALEDLDATCYWEGEVAIPIWHIQEDF